jgi:ATPase subunit of ABC transporter with duplicated ATPase domains
VITISDLSKRYGARTLFEGASMQLNAGERYGLVGANGAGKSTFARILAGQEGATDGNVAIPKRARIGVLVQDRFESDEQRILDVAMMGDEVAWRALHDKDKLLESGDVDAHVLGDLEEKILANDGYTLDARAGEVLEGLGIPAALHDEPLRVLSGGFKLRALLAQALASRPDLLVLDEPTNHLDIVSIRWLEKFLLGFAGVAVIVSHDRRFLDNVCTYIADVDYEAITLYRGDYEKFCADKEAERQRREKEIDKRKAEIADRQAFVDKFRAKASKARQAQSKMKQIERIQIEPLPESSRREPRFAFAQRRPSGKEVVTAKGVRKAYGDNVVLDGVDVAVRRGERVAILGENGIGKSTLLKVLTGDVAADGGEIEWGHEAHVSFFPQESADILPARGTAYEWLQGELSDEPISKVRGRLGAVLLSGDDADKQLKSLSGGEAARLVFARLSAAAPNVLILDEPTNHLDLESIESLSRALEAYDGTLVFVSHDRWFVSRLATRIIEIRRDGVSDFVGSYDEYLAHMGDDHLDVDHMTVRAKSDKADKADKGDKGDKAEPAKDEAATAPKAPKAKSKKGKPRDDGPRRRKKLEKQRDDTLAKIDAAEKRIAEIEQSFCEPGFFERTAEEEVRGLQHEQAEMSMRVDELTTRWERIETELEGLT